MRFCSGLSGPCPVVSMGTCLFAMLFRYPVAGLHTTVCSPVLWKWLRCCPRVFLGRTEKTIANLTTALWSLGWDISLAPARYEPLLKGSIFWVKKVVTNKWIRWGLNVNTCIYCVLFTICLIVFYHIGYIFYCFGYDCIGYVLLYVRSCLRFIVLCLLFIVLCTYYFMFAFYCIVLYYCIVLLYRFCLY
jgi:hypothetical protein